MSLSDANRRRTLAFVVGTGLQERLVRCLLPLITKIDALGKPAIVSLDAFYKFGLNVLNLGEVVRVRSFCSIPWYDRSKGLKLASLFPLACQMAILSRKFSDFLFFVDTGLIERTAITVLKHAGCGTVVLQDALKRHPKHAPIGSLQWFGGGNADLYLLMGERSRSMVVRGRVEVVGCPIYENQISPEPLMNNILIVNQCFSRYGETTIEKEYEFVRQVVAVAQSFASVELRLHPHNDPTRYRSLGSRTVHVTRIRPMHQSLEEAGIVLAVNSTVILEAMAKARPVLTLDWHPSPFELPIRVGIRRCRNIEDMRQALSVWKNGGCTIHDSTESIQGELLALNAYTGQEAIMRIASALEKFMSVNGSVKNNT